MGPALVRGAQDMLAGADELPALQRGRGHRKGAEWLCAHVGLPGCPPALAMGGNKDSGMNCAVELQCHQALAAACRAAG